MTIEAIALHLLDNLDAKINAFSREIRDDLSKNSSWTPFTQSLGRRIYKGHRQAEPKDGVANRDED
jgi:3'-5' exoribonuclease